MQFFAIAALFAATAFAVPHGGSSDREFCGFRSLLGGNPLCCGTDVLGLADLDCTVPREFPDSFNSFQSICADIGKQPRCCALPILGQALICQKPVGVRD